MKRFLIANFVFGLAVLLTGCSGADAEPVSELPPPAASTAAGEEMDPADKAMMETMAPGGIADPDQGS